MSDARPSKPLLQRLWEIAERGYDHPHARLTTDVIADVSLAAGVIEQLRNALVRIDELMVRERQSNKSYVREVRRTARDALCQSSMIRDQVPSARRYEPRSEAGDAQIASDTSGESHGRDE